MFPCKDCTRRAENCHTSCADYLESKEKRRQANARREADNEVTNYVVKTVYRRGKKNR